MNTNEKALLFLLESVLGKSKQTSGENFAFKCPNNCHPTKYKLEVNIETQQWQCWICHSRGKSIVNLLKQQKASPKQLEEAKLLTNSTEKLYIHKQQNQSIRLPEEYIKFDSIQNKHHKIISKHALKYLKNRRITDEDVLKYNIGFCPTGKYSNRIIIPSYDSEGVLNYFTARSFEEDVFEKYKNPPVASKEIIGMELLINWRAPIVVVEGIFDFLTLKRNTIPLFGKVIHDKLLKKLIEEKTEKIYIALDNDARKDAISACEKLLAHSKEVYLVEIDGKDISEIGAEKTLEILEETYPLTFGKLMELKLETI